MICIPPGTLVSGGYRVLRRLPVAADAFEVSHDAHPGQRLMLRLPCYNARLLGGPPPLDRFEWPDSGGKEALVFPLQGVVLAELVAPLPAPELARLWRMLRFCNERDAAEDFSLDAGLHRLPGAIQHDYPAPPFRHLLRRLLGPGLRGDRSWTLRELLEEGLQAPATRHDVGGVLSATGTVRAQVELLWGEREDALMLCVYEAVDVYQQGVPAREATLTALSLSFALGAELPELLSAATDAYVAATRESQARIGYEGGLGCCLVAVIHPERVELAWVGDSRAYLCRAGALRLLTRDHTLRQAALEAGAANPFADTRILTRGLLIEGAEWERAELTPEPGDRLLLCSHGVCDCLDDAQIAATLGQHHANAAALAALHVQALNAAKDDHLAAILFRVP